MRLDGKRALVTGAEAGIGRAVALLFALEGAEVAVANLSLAGAQEAAAAIQTIGGRAVAIGADMSKPEEVDAMVATALGALGGIDILVNNAGVGPVRAATSFDVHDYDAWDAVMAVNVRSVFQCSTLVAAWMKEHGGGKIVNVASRTGISGVPNINAYGPSKAAVINMTRSLAVEWAAYGINVNCVAPIWTRTPRFEKGLEAGTTSLEEIAKRCPMGRPAEPEEVAKAILFLASDDAGFITGVTLPVDGGWLACGYHTA